MTLVLHIGTHKTGTTAIQHFAETHREILRERGLWYPLYQDFGLKTHYAHHRLAHALAGNDEEQLQWARRFVAGIAAGRRDGETVLLSAEPMYRHTYPRKATDYWAGRAAYAKRLKTLLPDDDVQLLLVIRRQDSFARSLYQERVKVTRYDKPFKIFIDSEPQLFEYWNQLKVFLAEFPQARVLIYEDLLQPNLIDAFFAAFDTETQDLERDREFNVGWPIPLVEFKRNLNGSTLTDEQMQECRRALEQSASEITSSADWFVGDEAARFLARFDDQNAEVASRFFSGRDGPLFTPPKRSERQAFEGLTPREIGDLSAMLVRNRTLATLDPAPKKRPSLLRRLLRRLKRK